MGRKKWNDAEASVGLPLPQAHLNWPLVHLASTHPGHWLLVLQGLHGWPQDSYIKTRSIKARLGTKRKTSQGPPDLSAHKGWGNTETLRHHPCSTVGSRGRATERSSPSIPALLSTLQSLRQHCPQPDAFFHPLPQVCPLPPGPKCVYLQSPSPPGISLSHCRSKAQDAKWQASPCMATTWLPWRAPRPPALPGHSVTIGHLQGHSWA